MAEDTFALIVDVSDDRVDHDGLRTFIKANPDFTAWWNQIPSFYMVQTRLTPDEISEQVDRYAKNARFLVVKVDPQASQGRLPERGWAWLERRLTAPLSQEER